MTPLNGKLEFYKQEYIDDGFGSGQKNQDVLVLSTRCSRKMSTRTSAPQTQGGSFDFYQVYNFTIRGREGFNVTKDLTLKYNGEFYTIRGVAPVKDNPRYLLITTEIKNGSNN